VLSLPHLVRLFGPSATANPWLPFSDFFLARTRHVLTAMPASRQPWLWLMLAGRCPDAAPLPWLAAPSPARMPAVTLSCAPMQDVLQQIEPGSLDLVHLSNILDWLSEDQARATLQRAWRALRPGGLVFVRQLNSTLDIAACGDFDWQPERAQALLARDRSFFYRALHLGRRA
jgi:S-adenosylmethionine-diacylglycerol 3-amino-3-carboxypropyl transferase